MHIYLKHPIHGTKVAISDGEAKFDKLNGWIEYDPHFQNKESTEEEPVNNLGQKRKRVSAKEKILQEI